MQSRQWKDGAGLTRTRCGTAPYEYSGWNACSGLDTGALPLQ